MSYFTEIDSYKTYAAEADDFHFIYNANSGGGQSFLGGRFQAADGTMMSPTVLDGRVAAFRFEFADASGASHSLLLDDESACYDIKPRASGDSNMKLSVGRKTTPSEMVAAFLMLPEPCGVRHSENLSASVFCYHNYWLQSMWLKVDVAKAGKAIFTPRDCVFCGAVDKNGNGTARYYTIDISRRISDITELGALAQGEGAVVRCLRHYASIYKGEKKFIAGESAQLLKDAMMCLAEAHPDSYSGLIDPLTFLCELKRKEVARGDRLVDVDEFGLKIGDQSDDGAVTIVGADKLCYQVRNVSRGAEGIRTISKKLLGEWVIAVKDDPTATAEALRGKLTGKTEVDKFEYGYFSTLYKMAQMVLNKDSIKKLSAEELSRLIRGFKPGEPPRIDRLTVALQYFKEHRGEFAEGLKINDGVRAYFSPLTPQKLRAYSQEEFEDLFLGKEKYEHMWAGTNGKGWGHIQKAGRGASMNFIASICDKAIPAEQFCDKKFAAPSGFGPVVVAELNLKFHPTEYCAYSKRTAQALEILGLKKNTYTSGFTAAEYNEVLKQTEVIRGKMESMGIGLTREDDARPDYLSANELIDFVCNYEDELKKKFFEDEPELPKNVDRLTLALKLFAERRYSEEWQANVVKDSYLHIFKVCETAADDLRKMSLDEFKEKFLDRVWAFQNGGSRKYGQLSEEERVGYRDFVASLILPIKSFGDYFPPSEKCPRGMGVGMISELLMRFHPDACCSYNDQLIYDALVTLGLAEGEFEWPKTPSIYQDFMGKCAKILRKMEEMKFARTPVEGDKDKPNYITVNEFLWFVHDHKDLIKEKIMSAKMKTDKPTEYTGKRQQLSFNPNSKDDELLLRLLASLRAKPFAILAGHSGTGKSRYVKKLAYMTCNKNELRVDGKLPGNYLLLQVKPNWHDSTDLLGFRNAMERNEYQKTALIEFLFRAYHFSDTPFFLCLDEMNLAPVEQYFAEFLSAMESKEPVPLNDIKASEDNLVELGCEWTDARDYLAQRGFSIPSNLFIVGTVNMDETTNQFSRKVLDRAFTIEMTDVDFTRFGSVKDPSYDDTIEEAKIQELLKGDFAALKLDDEDMAEESPLVKVQKVLESTAFAIAYRFASEYTLLKRAFEVFDPGKVMKLDALDQSVLMKILPRVAGEADYIRKIYGEKDDEGLRKALAGKTMSLEKIKVILDRAKATNAQYITFWP